MKRALVLWFAAANAFAQCVMCNRTAAAQQAGRSAVLNTGIIVLLAPPLAILAGLSVLLWRKSRKDGN